MKLLLSTSNIMGGGSSIRKSSTSKSNAELVLSLRANFQDHAMLVHGQTNDDDISRSIPSSAWTKRSGETLEIPQLNLAESALLEEREQYDITAKLFFLPGTSTHDRALQMREAVDLVLKALSMPSIDLLILSFPGIYFDEQEDCPDKLSTRGSVEAAPEPLSEQVSTWQVLEQLKEEGIVSRLGVAEFGKDRLESLLEQVKIRPGVDQINLRDCCSVPKDLLTLAKAQNVELLVHNDCSNILPKGTIRDLLGPSGAGVLAEPSKTGDKRKNLHGETSKDDIDTGNLSGEIQPQWVIKYTAVVKNRGVVESKGYFAVASLTD